MQLLKHTIQDTIGNLINRWKGFRKYNQKIGKLVSPPKGYKLQFSDDFDKPLDKDKWQLGQPWGNFHPNNLNQHYDLDGKETYVSRSNQLVLELRHRPLHVIKSKLSNQKQYDSLPDEFTIPHASGLVISKESWQWGWFSAEIRLPQGKSLKPSFYLTDGDSNEINIFKGYSNKNYQVRMKPNLNYNSTKGSEVYEGYNIPIHVPCNRFVQYVCHWEPGFIRIYYDGVKVFETTDDKVLNSFNKQKMPDVASKKFIVMSNEADGFNPDEGAMVVRNVKVYSNKFANWV